MTAKRVDRTQGCSKADGRTRLHQAELYLTVAESVLAGESGEEATVATGNAVLAAMAAGDAICCARSGSRYRGGDHRRAADHLQAVTGDSRLAAKLRDVIDLKDTGHYGLRNVAEAQAKKAMRKAHQLVEAAREAVR